MSINIPTLMIPRVEKFERGKGGVSGGGVGRDFYPRPKIGAN